MNTFIHSYEFPPEPYPISDPNGQSLYPLSDQNGAKTLPFGAAHIYMASIRECPALPGQKVSANENFKSYRVQQNNSPSLQSQGQFRQDQASKEMLLSKRSGQLRHAVAYYHSVA